MPQDLKVLSVRIDAAIKARENAEDTWSGVKSWLGDGVIWRLAREAKSSSELVQRAVRKWRGRAFGDMRGRVVKAMLSPYANFVIMAAVDRGDSEPRILNQAEVDWVIDEVMDFMESGGDLVCHEFGVRVITRLLRHCRDCS